MNDTAERPPFSRNFSVSELRDTGREIAITANREECAAMAKANGIVGLAEVQADFIISRHGRNQLTVTGQVRAQVTQNCVLSLEPFTVPLLEVVDVRFETQIGGRKITALEVYSANGESDPPDLVVDGKIDLGVLAAEFLALGLDPYPRKPGAEFDAQPKAADEEVSPFAALKSKLLRKDGEK